MTDQINADTVLPGTSAHDGSDTLHGRTIHDPYRWLEDPGSANTRGWLTRQQDLFATHRAPSADHPQLVVIQDGTHRVLLDPVVLDPTGNTVLDRWEPSPDGSRIAV